MSSGHFGGQRRGFSEMRLRTTGPGPACRRSSAKLAAVTVPGQRGGGQAGVTVGPTLPGVWPGKLLSGAGHQSLHLLHGEEDGAPGRALRVFSEFSRVKHLLTAPPSSPPHRIHSGSFWAGQPHSNPKPRRQGRCPHSGGQLILFYLGLSQLQH